MAQKPKRISIRRWQYNGHFICYDKSQLWYISAADRPSFLAFLFSIMCRESVPLDTSTKVRFMLEQALFGAARLKGLYWGHIQLCRPPSCVGGNTFMTMNPALCRYDGWGTNSHNSLLDINDLWHLHWKSLQLHPAAGWHHRRLNYAKHERQKTVIQNAFKAPCM